MSKQQPPDVAELINVCFNLLPAMISSTIKGGKYEAAEAFLKSHEHFMNSLTLKYSAWRAAMFEEIEKRNNDNHL